MEHLDDISVDDLHDALAEVAEKKPTQRLLAAIAYKNDVTQTELAEWYDVERKTIYSWLMRFDTDEPLAEAVTDSHRSGRKRKLSEEDLNEFKQTVQEPPSAAGIDAQAWTPELVQQYLDECYGVEYSRPSCRRLLKEAGLSYQKPRLSTAEADPTNATNSTTSSFKSERRWMPR